MSSYAWRGILRASAIVSVGVLVGRIAGLVREVFLADRLGAGSDADIAIVVLTFPDLLTAILIGSAISSVLVPDFRALSLSRASASVLFVRAHVVAGAFGAAVAALVIVFAPALTRALAPGFGEQQVAMAAPLVGVAGLAIPLSALAAVTTSYLQARERFVVPAMGSTLFNAVLIGALVLAVRPGYVMPVATAIVIAALVRWLSQLVDAWRTRERSTVVAPTAPPVSSLVGRYVQALLGTSALLVVPFVGRAIASLGGPGDIAVLNYAWRILELPVGALATVAAVGALPLLSELAARDDREATARLLTRLWLATLVLLTPATIALIFAAGPIAALLFARGSVGTDAVTAIATIAGLSLLSLPAQGLNAAAQAVLIARRDLRALLVANIGVVLANALLALALAPVLGSPGIAVALVAMHWGLVPVFVLILRRRHALAIGGSALLMDAALAAVAAMVTYLPFAIAVRVLSTGSMGGLLVAVVGGGSALLVTSLLPLRTLSGRNAFTVLIGRDYQGG